MLHTVPSPFPFLVLDVPKPFAIVNERCACGALRSLHADTVAFGHGPCRITDCAKFTWVGHVTEDITPAPLRVLGTLDGWNVVADAGRIWLVNPLTGHRKSAFPASS